MNTHGLTLREDERLILSLTRLAKKADTPLQTIGKAEGALMMKTREGMNEWSGGQKAGTVII